MLEAARSRTKLFMLGLVLTVVALLLHLVGFATVSWVMIELQDEARTVMELGLWRVQVCREFNVGFRQGMLGYDPLMDRRRRVDDDDNCYTDSLDREFLNRELVNKYAGLQALESLGLVFLIAALIPGFLFAFGRIDSKRWGVLATAVLVFIGSILMIIGIAVLGAEIDNHHNHVGWQTPVRASASWSAVISAIGAGVAVIATIVLLIEMARAKPGKPDGPVRPVMNVVHKLSAKLSSGGEKLSSKLSGGGGKMSDKRGATRLS